MSENQIQTVINIDKYRINMMIAFLSTIVTCSAAASINDKNFGKLAVTTVDSIYDGDTFRVTIDQVHPLIGERIPIRLAKVDTPEIRGKCEKEKNLLRKPKSSLFHLLEIRRLSNYRTLKEENTSV